MRLHYQVNVARMVEMDLSPPKSVLRHKVPTFAPGIEVGLQFFGRGQHKVLISTMYA